MPNQGSETDFIQSLMLYRGLSSLLLFATQNNSSLKLFRLWRRLKQDFCLGPNLFRLCCLQFLWLANSKAFFFRLRPRRRVLRIGGTWYYVLSPYIRAVPPSSINQLSNLTSLYKRLRKSSPCAIVLLILFPDFDHPLALSYLGIPDQSSHKSHWSHRRSPRCLPSNTHLALPTAQAPLTLILPMPSPHHRVIHPSYLPISC